MVLTIHDLNFLNKDYSNEKIGHLIKKLQTKVDRADALVFISNFSLQEATKYLTFDPSISHVIYNGLPQRSVPSLTKPDYIKNEEFIFSIGIISPKKNFKVLIPLLLENPALHLIVAGVKEGRYAREIEEYAKELNVLERLIMPGPVSDSDKSWLYKNCRAFMFPSIAEGFGLPVIEAMSFGKPVFLSTHTSLPEIGGVEAYYFDSFEPQSMTHIFAQGMKDFSQDLEKKNRLKRYAETYSWTKAAKQYIDLYKSI
jgi:glycosyltransferase involved in cell wall biosynthesis